MHTISLIHLSPPNPMKIIPQHRTTMKPLAFCAPFMTSSPSSSPSSSTSPQQQRPTVFVAGATGNVGIRLVRLLTLDGFPVRACSRNPSDVFDMLSDDSFPLSSYASESSNLSSSSYPSFEKPVDKSLITPVALDISKASLSDLSSAVGADTSVVVSALGAPFSFGRVDGQGIGDLMSVAAANTATQQLIVVSSIGVGRPWAFPAAALNLFGGVLLFKDYSEQVTRKVARKNGKGYLIVRPGGMESPTDQFELTHNMKTYKRNSLAGGLVSNLQVARLIVEAIKHPDEARNKTLEVVATTDAPKVSCVELLQGIAQD